LIGLIPGVGESTVTLRPVVDSADDEHGGVLAIPGEGGLITVSDGIGLRAMLGPGATTVGLTPPLPISKEPNGIPVRAAPPGVVGDVAAADEAMLLEVEPHGPDIAVLPGIDTPVPIPIPPPSKVVVEPDIADDALPVVGQGNGLRPGDASCVAPMAIPVGATDEPGVMPSGEVAPMLGVGLPIPPTCAKAEQQLNSTAAAVTIAKRVIMGLTSSSTAFIALAWFDSTTMQSNARTWLRMNCRGLCDVVSIGERPRQICKGFRCFFAPRLRLVRVAAQRRPPHSPC
jgi:hypothetical protein